MLRFVINSFLFLLLLSCGQCSEEEIKGHSYQEDIPLTLPEVRIISALLDELKNPEAIEVTVEELTLPREKKISELIVPENNNFLSLKIYGPNFSNRNELENFFGNPSIRKRLVKLELFKVHHFYYQDFSGIFSLIEHDKFVNLGIIRIHFMNTVVHPLGLSAWEEYWDDSKQRLYLCRIVQ